MTKQARSLPLSKASYVGLWLSAVSMSGLALWQWLELLKVRQGGRALCALGETINCENVWDTPFATWVQSSLGMPVAAWGLVWGLGAVSWALLLARKATAWRALAVWGTRLWALAGTLACAGFAYVSWQAQSVCLSCLGTFVLVALYAFLALSLLPLKTALPRNAFAWAAVLSVVFVAFFGVALQPWGSKTAVAVVSLPEAQGGPTSLEGFLAALKPEERRKLESVRRVFVAAEGRPLSAPTPGRFPAQAPVVLQDFTDIKCGHCKTAEALLAELLQRMPPGSVAVEPRYYPLDPECNPSLRKGAALPSPPPVGVRCVAALAQICLEGAADFAQLRNALFNAAPHLATREEVLAIASRGPTPREQLEACVDSADAWARLQADIALAESHGIPGTPFFLLNGKQVGFSPAFWTAMVLAQGNAKHPAFGF